MKTRLETKEVEVRPPGVSDAPRDLAPDVVPLICAIQEDLTPGNPVRKSALMPPPQAHSLPLWLSRTQSNLVALNPTVFFSLSEPVATIRTFRFQLLPSLPRETQARPTGPVLSRVRHSVPQLMSIIAPLGAGSLTTVLSRPQEVKGGQWRSMEPNAKK